MLAKRNPLRAMQQVRTSLAARDPVLTDQFEQLIEAAVFAGWKPPRPRACRQGRPPARLPNPFVA